MKFENLSIIIVGVYLFIILLIGVGWVKNIIRLTNCDFKAPYKAEILHGVGIFPPIGAVMGWMDFGE